MSEPQATTVVDTLDFANAVRELPEQLAAARDRASDADLNGDLGNDIGNIVVLGMGGSGSAGDVLGAAARHALPVPVTTLKQYRTPAFVGPATLVFAVSYSGETEETLSMAEAAGDRGARLVAVSKGGSLERLASDRGGVHIGCPDGYQPRAALGALVAPLVVTLDRLGLFEGGTAEVTAAVDQLSRRRDRCAPEIEGASNPARELARQIGRTIPVVYGGGAIGGTAAMRWKTDVNENAKAPAFFNSYPELDHNEICGWGQHGDVTRQVFTLVELRHEFEHPQLSRRFDVTRGIIDETVAQVLSVTAEGRGRLAQLFDLIYVGMWTSLYLAFDAGVDPGPVEAIDRLKAALAR